MTTIIIFLKQITLYSILYCICSLNTCHIYVKKRHRYKLFDILFLQSLQDVTPFCPFDMRLIPVYHIKSHDSMTQTLLSKNINIFAEF